MPQKLRPVFTEGRQLDAIANLGAHWEGWARVLTPEQVAPLGLEIAKLVQAVNRQLWSWDDPHGEVFGEPDCRELLSRNQRLADSPRLFTLKKLQERPLLLVRLRFRRFLQVFQVIRQPGVLIIDSLS